MLSFFAPSVKERWAAHVCRLLVDVDPLLLRDVRGDKPHLNQCYFRINMGTILFEHDTDGGVSFLCGTCFVGANVF